MAGIYGMILGGLVSYFVVSIAGLGGRLGARALHHNNFSALFKLIPVTLTAAGIAGFILSVGMAVMPTF